MNAEENYYVYIWYVVETGEVFYVGKGKNDRYKKISKRNKFFIDFYNSHNCACKKIYENLTEEQAFDKEMETIKWYKDNTSYRLTNQTDGGEGTSGWTPTQEFKEKQSKIHRDQWQNEDFKKKMIQIRQDENGPYKNKEFRNKISELVKGENNPNFQHYWTNDMKKHLSQLRKDKEIAKDTNNPCAKKIICIETGEIFECIKFAMEKYDINTHGSITVCLKEPHRTAGGKHWALYDERFTDREYRFKYLIQIYCRRDKAKKNAIICYENMKIYNSAIDLSQEIGIEARQIREMFKQQKYILVNNKKYEKI